MRVCAAHYDTARPPNKDPDPQYVCLVFLSLPLINNADLLQNQSGPLTQLSRSL